MRVPSWAGQNSGIGRSTAIDQGQEAQITREAESQRREEAQRPHEELGGRQRLGHEAAAWAKAKYLRVYLAALESVNMERFTRVVRRISGLVGSISGRWARPIG